MHLDDRATESWDRDGWLLLPDALSPETLDRLQTGVDELTDWAVTGGPGLHHHEQTEHGPAIARSERFADDHTELGAFVRGASCTGPLAFLLGEPVVLFKEKVNYKHPGGGGFAPHQDAAAYRFVDHHVSVMVPLDPATEESGCLWFAPGHGAATLPTDDRGRLRDEVVERLDWRPVEVQPGDMVLFDSYAPHRSETNRSDRPRRALYLTYNRASLGDHRDRYYADKDAEFTRLGADVDGERVRISISDDFLGRPLAAPNTDPLR